MDASKKVAHLWSRVNPFPSDCPAVSHPKQETRVVGNGGARLADRLDGAGQAMATAVRGAVGLVEANHRCAALRGIGSPAWGSFRLQIARVFTPKWRHLPIALPPNCASLQEQQNSWILQFNGPSFKPQLQQLQCFLLVTSN